MSTRREAYNAYMAEYMKQRYYRRRAAAIRQLGGVCVDCGTVDSLEFDHRIASTKSFDIGRTLAGASEARLQAELEKCVLRCNPCHRLKTRRNGDIPSVGHGGGLTGKRNCYCDLCKPLKVAYAKARRDRLATQRAASSVRPELPALTG